MVSRFENMIIIGRPGSGKSEVVDLLRKTPLPKRIIHYYVGDFIEADDFVWLNEKLREDDIWEETGLPRKFSRRARDGCIITDGAIWDFILEMLNKEVEEKYLSDPDFYKLQTLFIEFSRGGKKTYRDSLALLSDRILSKSVIFHLDITYEEALTRNELRYREGQEDTKLHHKVPLEQMELSYRQSDWLSLSMGRDEGIIAIRDNNIPFVSVLNQPAPKNQAELEKMVMSAFHTLFVMKYGEHPKHARPAGQKATDTETFDHLFIFGRPASGKSEFIDFIRKAETQKRVEDFHIGVFEELDDYAMLSEKFKEDAIWKKVVGKAKYTTMENDIPIIQDLSLFNFAINSINNIVLKRYLPNIGFYEDKTLCIEFSRGGELGYLDTLKMFDPHVLEKGAMFYVRASFDECWRRNVARYEEKRRYSILAHMVPRAQMERLYRDDDWDKLTGGKESGWVTINGVEIPFVTLDNEVESKDPEVLTGRYRHSLNKLIDLYRTPRRRKRAVAKVRHFDNLFVFGRPAGGKSEFIDFMKKCDEIKRRKKFFVAPFDIIDDYLSIWDMGENEDIMEQLSVPRKFTEMADDGVVVTDGIFFNFISEKINRTMGRRYLSDLGYYDDRSLLIEFSRGTGLVGYHKSLSLLKTEILDQGAAIYIKVSYEEALRRNEERYREKLKHSVLAHKVPEKAMEAFYRQDDWEDITGGRGSGLLNINGVEIPFVTMENEPESKDLSVMEGRYAGALKTLFDIWMEKRG